MEEINLKNCLKLEVLLSQSAVVLRNIFQERWKLHSGNEWINGPSSSHIFQNGFFRDLFKKSQRIQKHWMVEGNINNFDIPLLAQLLNVLNIEIPLSPKSCAEVQVIINEIKEVRNQLAHHPTKNINNDDFEVLWVKLSNALTSLGFSHDKIIEFYSAENVGGLKILNPHVPNPENMLEANRYKENGNTSFGKQDFLNAVKFYTEAINLLGLSEELLSALYSNRSMAYLEMSNLNEAAKEKALTDAKRAVHYQPTSWKAYYRVGRAYDMKNKTQKAIDCFNKSLGLDPAHDDVRLARDNCKNRLEIIRRQEHLDPSTFVMSRTEMKFLLATTFGLPHIEFLSPSEVQVELRKSRDPKRIAAADVDLALLHLTGMDGIQKDYEEAARLFTKAVNAGNAEAMFNLGRLTQTGKGVERNISRALHLFHRASEQNAYNSYGYRNKGVAESEHAIALAYEGGIGYDKNYDFAKCWYSRSADHGFHGAANNLGVMYSKGIGVAVNLKLAVDHWEHAVLLGSVRAMESLEEYYTDIGDWVKAKYWWERSVEGGSIVAHERWASFYTTEEAFQRSQRTHMSTQEKDDFIESVTLWKLAHKSLLPFGGDLAFKGDVDMKRLAESAQKGSITANLLVSAFKYVLNAKNIFANYGSVAEMVKELAAAIRIEHITVSWRLDKMQELRTILESNLSRIGKADPSDFEKDLRLCYIWVRMNALEEMIEFTGVSIKRFPNESAFYSFKGSFLSMLGRNREALAVNEEALRIFPTHDYSYADITFDRAANLDRMSSMKSKKLIEAYNDFLKIAPRDHRKVPTAHYSIATLYTLLRIECPKETHKSCMDMCRKYYSLGLSSEAKQLSCFLPYESDIKKSIPYFLKMHDKSRGRRK